MAKIVEQKSTWDKLVAEVNNPENLNLVIPLVSFVGSLAMMRVFGQTLAV